MSQNPLFRTGLPSLIVGMTMAVSASCSGDNLVRPTEGSILIITSTTGSDVDPDGYVVTVDDKPEQAIGVREELAVNNLRLGDHNVTLTGVIANCSLGGAGQRTVNVVGGDTVNVTFRITCASVVPLPPPGDGNPMP